MASNHANENVRMPALLTKGARSVVGAIIIGEI